MHHYSESAGSNLSKHADESAQSGVVIESYPVMRQHNNTLTEIPIPMNNFRLSSSDFSQLLHQIFCKSR